MEKILLTGATGFIGRELLPRLVSEGYEVHTLERYVTGRYSIDCNAAVHYANLEDTIATREAVKNIQPDYVIHLAAISAVSFSYNHYAEVSQANYLGSVNLAEACLREANLRAFITAGTSEMYGMTLTDRNSHLSETHPLTPNSPYAVAKAAFSSYLQYMRMAYQFPFIEMRPFNTYGRKNNTHFFIERTITQMLSRSEVVLGDRATIRDWLYVDDHVEGYLKALKSPKAIGEAINLCTGVGYTTEETAGIIAGMLGFRGTIRWNSSEHRPLDAKILIGANTKAKRLLGWEPRHSLGDGLAKAIGYWRGVYGH